MKTSILIALSLAACGNISRPTSPTEPPLDGTASTYKIITPEGAQCTGWVIAPGYIATAGHCCDEEGEYSFIGTGGDEATGEVVFYEDKSQEGKAPLDHCLLKANGPIAEPMPLAAEMPGDGQPVEFVGYPMGHLFHSKGQYVGDADGPYQHYNDYFATTPCDHGASGSAMYSADGVYGILVRLYFTGAEVWPGVAGCVASPLPQIEELLKHI